MKIGTETNSLMNAVMAAAVDGAPAPEVGMGCTLLGWTDRKAGTIIKVTPTQVHVQLDTATRTDTNGMSDHQEYTYERDTNGTVKVFRLSKKLGRWIATGGGDRLAIGYRKAYHDYSF